MPIVKSPDYRATLALLSECGLPTEDLTTQHLQHFFGYQNRNTLHGVIGLEIHQHAGLLRSLAIAPQHQKCGYGRTLVQHVEQYARQQQLRTLALLTTTAAPFFTTLGYRTVPRHQAAPWLSATREFSHICPENAVILQKML